MHTVVRSRSKEVVISIDRPFVIIGERRLGSWTGSGPTP